MKPGFKRKIAPWLEREIKRLESGTVAERQRYKNLLPAIAKVMANPTSSEFSKDLPDGYKAVDVLQQYRLFFRLVHPPESRASTVYFVWINDEDSIHRTGKPDDCYAVFRKKLERGEIDGWTEEPVAEERFSLSADWGAEFIYAKYIRAVTGGEATAHSGLLALEAVGNLEYRISYISESESNLGLASALFDHLTEAADRRKVQLRFSLFTCSRLADFERSLLSAHGFEISADSGEDEEIWIRKPNHNH